MKLSLPFLLCCALFACGGEPSGAGASSKEPAAGAAVSVEIVDMAGLERALAARRGRPLILNFWAMW